MTALSCCGQPCRLTTGAEVWPYARAEILAKPIWVCDVCMGRVGCHPGGNEPLGTPAGPDLRRARMLLHDKMLDPIWHNAWTLPCYAEDRPLSPRQQRKGAKRGGDGKRLAITQQARRRTYAFLAARLGIPPEDCHVGAFDLEQCRAAWRALAGVTYEEIRAWHIDRAAAAVKAELAKADDQPRSDP